MHDERFGIADTSHMKDELQPVHQGGSSVEPAFHPESQHTAESMSEVFLSQLVVRVALQTRIVDTLHSRMLLEKLRHCKSILAAPLPAQ